MDVVISPQPCPVAIDVPLSFDKTLSSPREILSGLRRAPQTAELCLDFRIAGARMQVMGYHTIAYQAIHRRKITRYFDILVHKGR